MRMRARFAADRRGVSAVEFALIAPMLAIVIAGAADVSAGVTVKRKVNQTVSLVADLVAQDSTISASDVTAILSGAKAVILPFPTSGLGLVVSVVNVTSSGVTVSWAKASNATAPTAGSTTTATAPSAIRETGVQLVIAQATYTYTPPLAYLFGGARTISLQHIARPRQSDTVVLD